MAGDLVPVVGEGDDLPVLAGLGQVGVGVDQGVGAGVFGEEGEHRAGAMGPAGHVVLLQHRVVTVVHDGVEVQVERLAVGQPGGQRRFVQGGQERGLPGVLEPVGVGGQRGGLRQRADALVAIEKAAGLYRELAAARPDAFRPDLATSLNNLAILLGDLGRREDALTAIEEAVTIRREQAVRWPDFYHQELEQSLRVVAWLEASGDLSDTSPADLSNDNGPLSDLPATLGRSNALGYRDVQNRLICMRHPHAMAR